MPHLITIIKYACAIVKYILVFMDTILGEGKRVRVPSGQVVLFVRIGWENGFVW
jgi:hypothetical protein